MTRREFLKYSALVAGAIPLAQATNAFAVTRNPVNVARGPINHARRKRVRAGYPKVAAIDVGFPATIDNNERLKILSKHDLVISNYWNGQTPGGLSITNFVNTRLRALNPNLVIAQYVNFNEVHDTDGTQVDLRTKYDAEGWWLFQSDHSTKIDSCFGATYTETNMTAWTTVDSGGLRLPQWLAARHNTSYFTGGAFDHVFIDNVLKQPCPTTGCWKLNGGTQNNSDADVATAYREGVMAFVNTFRALQPTMGVITNSLVNGTGSDLSYAEYVNQFDGALLEGAIGASWGIENQEGWPAMMTRYRAGLANTKAPHIVILGTQGTSRDFTTMRYGLTSALLDDGYFGYDPTDTFSGFMQWFDEFDIPLGQPLDSPPTAAWSNGVWKREFEQGLVLCNPSGSQQVVTPTGGPWKKLYSAESSNVNDGTNVTGTVTIPNRDGIILLRRLT